jgi:copper oxidase (laccase) domain-containing protein
LGIYTADCCAAFIVDPGSGAVGLVHSGAKGTALRIVSKALEAMHRHFGCEVSQLVVALSPCIRPPLYEVDFARCIVNECREAGVAQVWDGGECTGSDTALYYSYRMEKGLTGRMLALLGG